MPVAAEAVSRDQATPVVIQVGDLIAFSGSHLHASGLNRTGKTRISTEVRTVDRGDFEARLGAPNVDGEAPRVTRQWFSGITVPGRL